MKNLCYPLIALMMSIPVQADEVSTAKTDEYAVTDVSPTASAQPAFLNIDNEKNSVIVNFQELDGIFSNTDSSSLIERLKSYLNSKGIPTIENNKGNTKPIIIDNEPVDINTTNEDDNKYIKFIIIDDNSADIKTTRKEVFRLNFTYSQPSEVLKEIKGELDHRFSTRKYRYVIISLTYYEKTKELRTDIDFLTSNYYPKPRYKQLTADQHGEL